MGVTSSAQRTAASEHAQRADADLGVLVLGINTHRAVDEAYKTFLSLVASQVASSLVTARAHDEEKKRASALAELNRAKTIFFNNISHEFRTPLTLMLGPLEELLYNNANLSLGTEEKNTLTLVHRNGLRLLKLVNVLLDFSRIEAGRMQAAFRPVDLCALTAELASVFSEACDKANIQLRTDCSTQSLSRPVYVDIDMWEKIILNLVSNAYKFTLKGEIQVMVEEEESAARVTVRDTGCGVPETEMARLFERFHRIQTGIARTHEGIIYITQAMEKRAWKRFISNHDFHKRARVRCVHVLCGCLRFLFRHRHRLGSGL